MIFDYPPPRNQRRHEPRGYKNYSAYLPWLRDEFKFRCVYCLQREQWGRVTGEFAIDHFQPQVRNPNRRLDYLNLLYSCLRCNSVKGDAEVADPSIELTSETVRVLQSGKIIGLSTAVQRLIIQLDLNSPRVVEMRALWMEVVNALAETNRHELLKQIVGFPNDLPDLRKLKPPDGNGRPEGIAESWLMQRESGVLPDFY